MPTIGKNMKRKQAMFLMMLSTVVVRPSATGNTVSTASSKNMGTVPITKQADRMHST